MNDVPDVLPIPRTYGSALCASCHDPAAENTAAGADLTSFNDSLTARLRARPARGQVHFSHEAHIAVQDRNDPDTCLQCHAGIVDADALYLAESQIETERCADCHTTAFEFDEVEQESWTAATFLHKKHLRGQALNQSPRLDQLRCFACHEHDPEAGGYRLNEAFRGDAYGACMDCHQDRAVERHGQLGQCSECHALSPDALTGLGLTDIGWWQETRPRVDVERPSIESFLFGATHHDFVTGAEEPPSDCLQCHRVRPESRPSRASGKPFDHRSHVPPDSSTWSRESCTRCHAQVAKSPSPKRLSGERTDDGARLTFETAACRTCHRADGLELLAASETRPVIRFSHQDHDNRRHAGERMQCSTCHVESNGHMPLRPEAADCTLCHTHERPGTTHDFSIENVSQCIDCHRIGVPEPRVAARVQRQRVSGRGPGQSSHSGAAFEASCADCHLNLGGSQASPVGLRATRSHAVQSTRLFKMHSALNPDLPRGNFYVNQGEHRSFCIDCHWADNLAQRRQHQWNQEPYAREASKIRETYGDQLDDYPGRKSFGSDDPLAR